MLVLDVAHPTNSSTQANLIGAFLNFETRGLAQCRPTTGRAPVDLVEIVHAARQKFPYDPTCLYLDRQYMLGGDLLVAPVFNDQGDVTYYVPEGEWVGFLTLEPVLGPK